MLDWLFKKKSKSRLGIDLGSSSIKLVEVDEKDSRVYLKNYALAQLKSSANFNIAGLPEAQAAEILKALLDRAGVAGRSASVSLPAEKIFSTIMEMPTMSESEIGAAISFEAQKYVPVPLEEVVLDWTVITHQKDLVSANQDNKKSLPVKPSVAKAGGALTTTQVFLVAVPKELIDRAMNIARLSGVEVLALEHEAFSLVRSLVGNDKNTFLLIDLGNVRTALVVVDQGFIRLNHNIQTTKKEAVAIEVDRIVNLFELKYNKRIGTCLLVGGRAGEKETADFLTAKIKIPFKIGDPFARVASDSALISILKDLGPQMAVAAGLAMRN